MALYSQSESDALSFVTESADFESKFDVTPAIDVSFIGQVRVQRVNLCTLWDRLA